VEVPFFKDDGLGAQIRERRSSWHLEEDTM
jgi:hypothetical protein